jgi:anti-sigma-K factor RskA
MGIDKSQDLKNQIQRLEKQLADLQARLPAHSIPPKMIAEMDEIDEQLREARSRLKEVEMGRE